MSDPSTDDTMEFAIDDVTGLLLRARSSNGKLPAEVIDVEIYEHLPDTTFDWDGEIAPPSENERHRHPDHLRKVHFLAQEIAPTGTGPPGSTSNPLSVIHTPVKSSPRSPSTVTRPWLGGPGRLSPP